MIYRIWLAAIALTALSISCASAEIFDYSKYPDLKGQWLPIGGPGRFDMSKAWGPEQEAPLTPEYQAIFEATLKDRASGGLRGDPTGLCVPHGLPRMMVAIFPVEFVVTPNVTYYLTDYTTPRRIFTDGRKWPDEVLPSFNGYSIGRWIDEDGDGRYDVLEVETRGFKSPRTFEGSGLQLHRDGASVIKERIYLDKTDEGLLYDEVTTIDNALTRPWTVKRSYRRERDAVWDIVDCAENNPHVVIGDETYMLSADGYLMPTKTGQPSPDLRYFAKPKK